MPIGYLERTRRLNANKGYMRRKIRRAGRAALWNLITMPEDPTLTHPGKRKTLVQQTADHLRFLAKVWIDQDGDVISDKAKEEYYREHGFTTPVDHGYNWEELDDVPDTMGEIA